MLGHRELVLEDYLSILRRRLWWIVVPAIIGPLIGLGIALKLPNRYKSQTLVLVEQQKVPEGFVKPVVTEELNERLATMQEQILSRTRLQPIIERFGLFQDEGNFSMEEKLDRMRKAITVSAVKADFGTRASGGLPGFYISFTASTARLAQQVCSEITSMFMQENLRAREQSAQGTTDFLTSQLGDAKRNLDDQDAKLAAFKRKFIGQLPGQEQTNLNMLTSLNTQLATVTDAINRLHQDRTYTESMLNAQLSNWKSAQTNTNPETLEQQLDAAQAQLVTLQSKYTDTHPDVIKQKATIESLKKKVDENRIAETKLDTESPKGLEPVQVQQLRAQLTGMNSALKVKERDQERIQNQMRIYESRVQLSPVVEEQYKQLTRDYQTALGFYNDLLTKKTQSEMATDLERRQQGEQFRVMDPPNLPEKPTFPDHLMFASGGLGAGLALGLLIAFFLEMQDKAIRNERDVEFYLELPALALVPSLDAEPKRRGLRLHRRKTERTSRLISA